jgi:hypothetical protein
MKKILCAALMMMSGVLSSASASADDKVSPGMVCVKVGTSGVYEVDAWGKVRNLSATEPLNVVCPLLKDDALWSVDQVHVRGLDTTTVGQISCRVGATEADRDMIYWSATGYSGGVGNNLPAGWYDMPLVPPGIQESGSVILNCWLPPTQAGNASSIASFYWDET